MLQAVQFHAAVPVEFQVTLTRPLKKSLKGGPRRQKCRNLRVSARGYGYLSLLPRGKPDQDSCAGGRASGLMRGQPARRQALFLISFSNGRNDIVNCQEGVHHFRIKVFAGLIFNIA